MDEKIFIVKKSYTDNPKQLIFNENFLCLKDIGFETNLDTTFQKEEIADFRYGIRWIRFELTYGREYQIFIRNKKGEVLKISFKSYLGRKKDILHKLYAEIVDGLWDYYFVTIINNYIDKFNNEEEFTIGDVLFNKEGIRLNISGIFNQKKIAIPWKEVRSQNYYTYFSIYSSANPSEINRGYNYKEDWNTSVLYSVLRYILKNKGIEIKG